MIKTNYKNFLLEKLSDDELSYYAFDWDDNILIMDTMIHLDKMVDGEWKPVDVSTSDFRDIRKHIDLWRNGKEELWRYRNGDGNEAYCEFRDFGVRGRNAFIEDTISSVKSNSFGPSWYRFINCLVSGNLFMIATARGHEPDVIRDAVEWIIYNYLNNSQRKEMEKNLRDFNKLFGVNDKNMDFKEILDLYLNSCDFIGISSSYFKRKYKFEGKTLNPELGKKLALREFVKKINDFGKTINKKVKIGFSDDDLSTVQHVRDYMRKELSLDFPIDYHIYHTLDGIKKIPF